MSGEKRVFKKIVALLTALLLVAGMLPTMDVTKVAADTTEPHVHGGVTFEAWTNSAHLPTSGSYYLDTDVASGGTQNLTGDLNLCLNGHTVTFTTGVTPTIFINIDGAYTLNLYDCQPWDSANPTGFTGVNDRSQGCAIYLNNDSAVFNMYGGAIFENNGAYGAGVRVDKGTFNMLGGVICNNTASNSGGGVYVGANATFNMSVGTISNNSARSGGGVYNENKMVMTGGEIKNNSVGYSGGGVYNDEVMTMSGGKIQNNTATVNGGGVFSNGTGTIFIGGAAVIDNNFIGDLANNLSINNYYSYYSDPDDKSIIVGTKTGTSEGNGVPVPATGMHVGISLKNPLVYEEYGPFFDWPIVREDGSKLSASYIFSDSPDCAVEFRDDDTVYLKHSVYSIGDGRFEYDKQTAEEDADGSVLFKNVLEATLGAGATFDGWYTRRTGGTKVTECVSGPDYYAHWSYNGTPIITEPIYVYSDKVVIGGEICSNDVLADYKLSFDSTTSTLTADGAVMVVNTEAIYPYFLYGANGNTTDDIYAAAVNVLTEGTDATTFVMKGNTYISCSGLTYVLGENDCRPSDFGGGVYVAEDCKFIFESGTIDNNISSGYGGGAGGGIFLDYGAYAEMNGGTISSILGENGTLSAAYGGGVYVSDSAEFVMNGGTISGHAAGVGGGIYVANGGTFKMTGGTIKENTAEMGAGVFMNTNAYVSISGGQIINNISDGYSGGAGGGIYIPASSISDYSCLAEGTMITMADGSQKAIETLSKGDEVRVFDHETGEVSVSKIYDLFHYSEPQTDAFELYFSNDIVVRVVGGHSFYEKESNDYIDITAENACEYIGHHFYNLDDDSWEILEGLTVITEPVETYFIATEKQINCVTDKMLSNEDGFYAVLCHIFEYDEDMKYDAAKKAADIEKYGLWSFEEAEYATKETYDALNLQYMNIAFGKGLITPEGLKAQGAYSSESYGGNLFRTANDSSETEPVKKVFSTNYKSGPATSGLFIGGNTVITDNLPDNVLISTSTPLTIGDGNNGCALPGPNMKIGVALEDAPYTGPFTTNGIENYVKYFSSDYPEQYVTFNTDHLELAEIPADNYLITVESAANGTVVADKAIAEAGSPVALTVTPDVGYKLKQLSVTTVETSSTAVEVVDDVFTMPAVGVKVTAVFEANSTPTPDPTPAPEPEPEPEPVVITKYYVTFNLQGHGKTVGMIEVAEGSKLCPPTPSTTDDYVFGGWYKDSDCISAWNSSIDDVTSDFTLYALWNAPAGEYTVPVENETSVEVSAEINGREAVLDEVTDVVLESITEADEDGSGSDSIAINLSGVEGKIESLVMSKSSVENIIGAMKDTSNTADTLEIRLPDATLRLDQTAVTGMYDQSKGDDIRLVVRDNNISELNPVQKEALKGANIAGVIDAHIESNGVEIHSFNGGNIEVSIKFKPEAGKDIKHYFVNYVAENGNMEKFATIVADGYLKFITGHFSDYVIVYDETAENDTYEPAASEASEEEGVIYLRMSKIIGLGNTFALNVTNVSDDAEVEFTSSDEAVATVDENGVITAVNKGRCTITGIIKQRDITYKFEIAVRAKKTDMGNRQIKDSECLTPNSLTPLLNIYKVVRTDKPFKFELNGLTKDAIVTFSSEDETIATVSKDGVITGLKKGYTGINVYVKKDDKTYQYRIFVRVSTGK